MTNFRRSLVFAATAAASCAVVVWAAGRATAQTAAVAPLDLSLYRNRNRLVFVFAPTAKNEAFVQQESLWKNKAAGFTDRDLIAFSVLGSGQSKRGPYGLPPHDADQLRQRFGIKVGEFRVVLVGKDGHTAYSSGRPVPLPALFGRIDAMPMRRDEMRRKSSGKPS